MAGRAHLASASGLAFQSIVVLRLRESYSVEFRSGPQAERELLCRIGRTA